MLPFHRFMKDSEWTLFMERLFKSTPNDPISYKSFTHVVGELISPSSVWKAIEEMQNKHMIRLAGWVRETIIRGLIKGTGQDLRLVFRKIAGDNGTSFVHGGTTLHLHAGLIHVGCC